MKYLKKFEGNETELYKRIYQYQYQNATNKLEQYSPYERGFLEKHIKDINKLKIYPKLHIGTSINSKTGQKIPESITISYEPVERRKYDLNIFLLNIDKGEDYWYYIFDWNAYYKCDDIIGVTKCINDILKNKFKNENKEV
jgi:hypothetical protein